MSFRRPRTLTSFGLALALALTACSKSSSTGGGSSPSPSAAASATPTAVASPSAVPTGGAYSQNGVSFQYPEGWQESTLIGTSASAGSANWSATVAIDEVNFVTLAEYTNEVSITADTIGDQQDSLTSQISDLLTQAGGGLESGPTQETMAGLPALGYIGTALNPDGVEVRSRLVLAFDGTTEYFVNCQFTAESEADVLAGCSMIQNSFQIG
ncbi:MAG: hypothetical protein HYU54_10545 [Actinobacteria bacterium]|nr:hypothetical protein [Actinomycetota bacterium]